LCNSLAKNKYHFPPATLNVAGFFASKNKEIIVKVVHYSRTPLAGAPWQIFQCLKNYTDLDVRLVNQKANYADKRSFPKDLLLASDEAKQVLIDADVVHVHNYWDKELDVLLDRKHQRILSTLHSVPRQGNWRETLQKSHKSYCIRQPMQMAEYVNFPTLPNMFDIWKWIPKEIPSNREIGIVYCPTNKLPADKVASKAYPFVQPLIEKIARQYSNVYLICHTSMPYIQNLETKRNGRIVIDDVSPQSKTFHLTSIEGASHAQAVLTSLPKKHGYPFCETTVGSLEWWLHYLIEDFDRLCKIGLETREWAEKSWNPKIQVQDYLDAYKQV
jgi:hypothetical protein